MAEINDWQEVSANQINDWQEQPIAKQPNVAPVAGAFGRSVQYPNMTPQQAQEIQKSMVESTPAITSTAGSLAGGPLGGIAGAAGGAALKQLLQGKPVASPETAMDAALYSAPELIGPVASLAGKSTGKLGDLLLQKAVGLKKYVPGLGKTLGEEGLVGTKGMMSKQIEKGLGSRGQEIGELAKSVQEVSTKPVAEQLGEKAAKYVGPEGEILPDNIKAFHKYVDAATQASKEGAVTGEEAAFRRAQYGKTAREAGAYRDNPAQGLKAQIARSQQAGYSQALKDAYEAANPGSTAMSEADKAYGALSSARTAINAPESLSTIGIASKLAAPAIGASLGYNEGGIKGALTGAALTSPLGMSSLGRLGLGTSKVLESPTLQQILTQGSRATLQKRKKEQDQE